VGQAHGHWLAGTGALAARRVNAGIIVARTGMTGRLAEVALYKCFVYLLIS